MTRNTRPPQLENRNLFDLELELSVCVQSRNDHKPGVQFKNCNMSGTFYQSINLSYHGSDMQKNTG